MSTSLQALGDLITRESGIKVDETTHRSLAMAAERAAPGMDAGALLKALREGPQGPELLRRLIDEMTVNETFFFRHAKYLLAINWPSLLARARAAGSPAIRVWVAGCATGEEAYTLAILASEAFAPGPAPVSILATDISGAALASAQRGVYGRRAVRGIGPDLRTRYLTPAGNETAVNERLRKIVRFARHNLVRDPSPPGPFDLITCRNVLIYFDGATAARVIGSLERSLSPQGQLILGAADRISAPPAIVSSAPRVRRPRSPEPRRPRTRASHAAAPPKVAPRLAQAGTNGIREALAAANAGRLGTAIELVAGVLALDPLNAEAHFVRGLAELGAGDAHAATASLRRALYVRPEFGLAAFKLGRALELGGDPAAAAQAYKQALRSLDRDDAEPATILDQVSSADVVAACRLRLRVLAGRAGAGGRKISTRAAR